MDFYLWEILVPTVSNEGKPYRTRYHKVWDAKIRTLTHGLTIFQPAKGQWLAPNGNIFAERMIPVRVMCTALQIQQIADLTANYYSQHAIMFYKLSDTVQVVHYELDKQGKRKPLFKLFTMNSL